MYTCVSRLTEVTMLSPSSSLSLPPSAAAVIFSVSDRLKSRLLLATAVNDDESTTSIISHAFSAAAALAPVYQTVTVTWESHAAVHSTPNFNKFIFVI